MATRLRNANSLIAPALTETLAELKLGSVDKAVIRLAERYAAEIDAGADLEKMGPRLLATLVELGATPAARARRKEQPAPRGGGKLQALREARGA